GGLVNSRCQHPTSCGICRDPISRALDIVREWSGIESSGGFANTLSPAGVEQRPLAQMKQDAAASIDFARNGGVVPVVAQDYASRRVLMVAYMNREAFEETVATGRACYYSRSRRRLWRKGEESG